MKICAKLEQVIQYAADDVFLCSYTEGKEAMGKSQYEKAVICFSKAIALQPEQVDKQVFSVKEVYVSKLPVVIILCVFYLLVYLSVLTCAVVCFRLSCM